MNITEEQRRAIETQGKVIVSASAGSGKTFVMIERLVSLILSGVSVKEVLAVTFTNKAAAQMRDRLRRALLERVGSAEGREREMLKRQLEDLPSADISTIHAFCGRLIRTHFYLAEIDPAFRIVSADDAEGKALLDRALDEVFETAYAENGADFKALLAVYFRKKRDQRLRELVLDLYRSARGLADYRERLQCIGTENAFDDACAYLASDFRLRAERMMRRAEELILFSQEGFPKTLKLSNEILAATKPLSEEYDLFRLAALAANPPALSVSPRATKLEGEELRAVRRLQALSKAVKELYSELREFAPREVEEARYLDGRRRAQALSTLALQFDEVYSRFKRENGALDYDDLEHLALKVLSDPEVLEEVHERYRYLFVDEYQDVNPAQERILNLVGGENIFLVGDGKQAIYGFRGSKTRFFIEKAENFSNSLELTRNFRSAPAVLDAVNRVFAPIIPNYPNMAGDRYQGYQGLVRFHTVEKEEKEERERGIYSVLQTLTPNTDALAERVADLVEEELGEEWQDVDADPEKRVKHVKLGDVAVLTRTNTGDGGRIVRALSARGIPVTSSSHVNVCDFFEGRLLIDWLSWLDNAEQDIPMASAMLSLIGGFTEHDLATVRLKTEKALRTPRFTFRDACRAYVDGYRASGDALSRRLEAFFEKSEEYRRLARVKSAAEMIAILLADGLEAQIAAKRDGKGRLARVRRLLAESEGAGSVHAFLKKLKASGYRVDFAESGGEGSVKVLTMHASKGLEYPVVILAGMDAPFHGADRDELMWTERFLIAPKSFDTEKKLAYETVLRRASALAEKRESVSEERNLLYVAMTRARCRLHLLFSEREHSYDPEDAARFSEFFDLDGLSDLCADERVEKGPALERETLVYPAQEELTAKILGVYKKPYRYSESTRLPVKSSATELMREDGVEVQKVYIPRHGATVSTETGTAYHLFLEKVNFGAGAKEELARMKEEGVFREEQLALLDENQLEKILALPCMKALAGKRVYREQKFLCALPAFEIMGGDSADEIVFQGAIDALVEDENGFEIVDYKFSSRSDEELKEHYALQIKLYRKAVSRAMKVGEETVRARIINIMQGREIEM